jgi:excisionase family DNA binding protein
MSAKPKLAYTVKEACDAVGLCKSQLYVEAAEGRLEMGKLGGRTVIRAEELRRWFAARYAPTITTRDC